jgi:hypothetical protein
MYNFQFYSPEAIEYFQFLPETENVKLKSRKSCRSCQKIIIKKLLCGQRIQLRLVDYIGKANLTF